MRWWRLQMLGERALGGFTHAGGTRAAAAIAYYALLSFIPLLLALAGLTSLVLGGERVDDLIDQAVERLPLTPEGKVDLNRMLSAAGSGSGALSLISILALMWTASGMMGAVRAGVTAVMGASRSRPFITGKLIDLAMVLSAGIVLLAAAVLTVLIRLADRELLGPLGVTGGATVAGIVVPVSLSALVLAGLMRLVPAEGPPWSATWRAALVGAGALWVLSTGFAFYVANFSNYNAIYGSLGAVVAFLIFVFLSSVVMLLTAATAAAWPEVAAAKTKPPDNPYGVPTKVRLRSIVRGLFR